MATDTLFETTAPENSGTRAGGIASSLWREIKTWNDSRKAIAHLKSLDDHMLNDIGLPRAEIRDRVMGKNN